MDKALQLHTFSMVSEYTTILSRNRPRTACSASCCTDPYFQTHKDPHFQQVLPIWHVENHLSKHSCHIPLRALFQPLWTAICKCLREWLDCVLLVHLCWCGDYLWTLETISLSLEVGFQFRQVGSAGTHDQSCFLLSLLLVSCQLQSDNINECWQSPSISQHFQSVQKSRQVLSQLSEKES